ncbi:MAG TPA: DNA double-strand break repair nuclease NurA [Puia sp.]|nr:DNA double-strand break repair nuclease NurA [Puia sp.]
MGGNKIEGREYENLDSRDFALIRSIEKNDGASLITILFISRISQRLTHARVVRLVQETIKDSMAVFREGSAGFQELAILFPETKIPEKNNDPQVTTTQKPHKKLPSFAPMPQEPEHSSHSRTVKEKLQSPGIFEQMIKVSSDLSSTARLELFDTIDQLATQLRKVLTVSGRILRIEKNHPEAWKAVKGKSIGFVDGGLANLSMLGSAPIAARVGGYIVRPGETTPERERFITLKKLINELYSSSDGGVYDGRFPDISALRDAARISIEAAGAVRLMEEDPSLRYLFMHGALVNPVSRYTDIMRDGQPFHRFPGFSQEALEELLPGTHPLPTGQSSNFISVYLRQLQILENSAATVCGVIEREATTSSVIRAVLNSLDDQVIAPVLPLPPAQWKEWFRGIIDPAQEEDDFGQRITDSLLFRCVLEPGEALIPVEINRNELRRAPETWKGVISHYPRPQVSYLQPTEWNSPIRLEIFGKDLDNFAKTAELVLHCSLLLPKYAFPAGLDIVDKFARIPDWMSKTVNTNTAVQALKQAMYKGDERLFDALRRMLCGSDREWLYRPGINR